MIKNVKSGFKFLILGKPQNRFLNVLALRISEFHICYLYRISSPVPIKTRNTHEITGLKINAERGKILPRF